MKIATYLLNATTYVGLVNEGEQSVRPYALNAEQAARGLLPILEVQAAGAALPTLGESIALSKVKLLAPIPRPRRNIFCVGKNYFEHAQEFGKSGFDSSTMKAGDEIPQDPIIFSKVPECVIAQGEAIEIPAASSSIDYEAELAVIIGTGGKCISEADAMRHVWGYSIINDVTARDWQIRHKQWHMGKSFDTFAPMGPWVVSADECDGTNTQLKLWVNGELRQNASTRDLIFKIPKLIATLSAGITLYPGDIIATGTPVGVGIGFKPPKFLAAGDQVRIQIDGIGILDNPVVQAAK